ncbi:MAG: acyltransferase [Acidobacteria bacterium]|nr:acyltransferase [Acidobacteriota bacterium]
MRNFDAPRTGAYLHTIDLLRFLVCFGVVLGHLASQQTIGTVASQFLNSGVGSTFFFLLSGYVVVSTRTFWRTSWRNFAIGRFARLWPAHILGLLMCAPTALIGLDRVPLPEFLQGFTWRFLAMDAVHGMFFGLDTAIWNGPAWSVTPLLYGGFLLPLWKWLRAGEWRSRTILGALLFLFLVRVIEVAAPPFATTHEQVTARHIEPLAHMLEVLFGGLLAILLPKLSLESVPGFVRRDAAFLLALLGVVVPIAAAAAFGGSVAAFYVVHGPILPAMTLFLAAASLNTGRIERFSRSRVVKIGAEISMPLFLLHMPISRLSTALLKRMGVTAAGVGEAFFVTLLIGISIAACYALIPLLEQVRTALTALLTDSEREAIEPARSTARA